MKDILTIDRRKWKTGDFVEGNEEYHGSGIVTQLKNDEGFMCCLGFRCHQLGVSSKLLLNNTAPNDIKGWSIPDLITGNGRNSAFTNKAMTINDDESLTHKKREEKIIAHFATINVIVKFINNYPKKFREQEIKLEKA